MFQGTSERITRNLTALARITMRIITVLFDRVVDVPVVMQRQTPTFQGADTCGSPAGVVLCARLLFLRG